MKKTARFKLATALGRLGVTSAALSLGLLAASLQARPVPQNLAGGLETLVQSNVAMKAQAGKGAQQNALYNGYATPEAARYADLAIRDAQTNRFLVDIHPRSMNVKAEKLATMLQNKFPSFTVTALDKTYHGVGVVEGFIKLDDVPALANMPAVRSVSLGIKPVLSRSVLGTHIQPGDKLPVLGTTTDQGVYQHRVDQIDKFYNPKAPVDLEGQGMSIGFISDSYGNSATDVANFDLPGASNNPVNTQPVVVLQDVSGTDEGRGMVQIGYKMAPKARLAFATANLGEVGFANNIRALAALPGYTYPPNIQQGFKADVICDDVGYSDEPFFQDGIIANAVDDVFAAGVSYFSSAGNDIGTYDYDSDFRYVPNDSHALDGTNINLTGVPTSLYQGGFHNFNPNPGQQDIAQTVNVLSSGEPATNFQWDDPFNQLPAYDPDPIWTQHGNYTGTQQTFNTPSLTAGKTYVLAITADTGSTYDAIVTLKDPNGTIIVNNQDTGTDEYVTFQAMVSGSYTVILTSYGGTTGAFTINLYNAQPQPQITTDFNLLVFDLEGNYLSGSSLTTNNYLTNVPFEYGATTPKAGEKQVQYVIARSTIPSGPAATHIRWIIRGNGLSGIGPAEYFTVNTPNTHGHSVANGCNGTAAYSVFRPSIPEYYTSPGPATIYFDKQGNRLPTPEVRLQPGVAAADDGNTSFFGGDDVGDLDTKPNFSGTSAASPHAAAIAALVLQAHGGSGSVTPSQMMHVLHRAAFPHDLDPNFASARAQTSDGGLVKFTANLDLGLNPSAGVNDPNSLTVSYSGPGSLATLVFNPQGTAATGGNTTGGNNGLDLTNTYFDNVYPGLVFEPTTKPFTVGNSDVSQGDVTVNYSNQAPLPSVAGQWWTMSLQFADGAFTSGKTLRFTVGHGPQHNRLVTNGTGHDDGATSTSFVMADLFGGETLLPDAPIDRAGMTFSGTTSGGGTFSGKISNHVGKGYSPLDGFGFINAQAAVRLGLQ